MLGCAIFVELKNCTLKHIKKNPLPSGPRAAGFSPIWDLRSSRSTFSWSQSLSRPWASSTSPYWTHTATDNTLTPDQPKIIVLWIQINYILVGSGYRTLYWPQLESGSEPFHTILRQKKMIQPVFLKHFSLKKKTLQDLKFFLFAYFESSGSGSTQMAVYGSYCGSGSTTLAQKSSTHCIPCSRPALPGRRGHWSYLWGCWSAPLSAPACRAGPRWRRPAPSGWGAGAPCSAWSCGPGRSASAGRIYTAKKTVFRIRGSAFVIPPGSGSAYRKADPYKRCKTDTSFKFLAIFYSTEINTCNGIKE